MMSSNVNYSIDELSEKLGMSYRTIYRYIDTFKEARFVVEKLYSNVYKLGKMPKMACDFSKLIYFSEEEAYLVNNLIDGISETNTLKANLKKKLSAIYSNTNIAEYVGKKSNAAAIEDLANAIREKKKVVQLSLRAKNLLIEEYPLAERDLKRKGTVWFLDTDVSALEGVGRFVAGLAHEIKVVEGEELKEYLRKYTAKYMAKI